MESRQSSQDENLPLPESLNIFIEIYDILESALKSIDLEKTDNLEARISAINDFIEMLGSLQNFYSIKHAEDYINPILIYMSNRVDPTLLEKYHISYNKLSRKLLDFTDLELSFNMFRITLYLKSQKAEPLAIKCCKRLNITASILLQFPILAKELTKINLNSLLNEKKNSSLENNFPKNICRYMNITLFKRKDATNINLNHTFNENKSLFLLQPNEVLFIIFSFLSKQDLVAIAQTCLKLSSFLVYNKSLFNQAPYNLLNYSLAKPIIKLTSETRELSLIAQLENYNFITRDQLPSHSLTIWDANFKKCIASKYYDSYWLNSLIVLPNNKVLLHLRDRNQLQIWCGVTGERHQSIPLSTSYPTFFALKNGQIIISKPHVIKAWHSETATWNTIFHTGTDKRGIFLGELTNGNIITYNSSGIATYNVVKNTRSFYPVTNLLSAQLLENGNLLLKIDKSIFIPTEGLILLNSSTSKEFPIHGIYPKLILALPNNNFLVSNEIEIHIYEGNTGKLINKVFHISQLQSFWPMTNNPSKICDIIKSPHGGIVIRMNNGSVFKINFEKYNFEAIKQPASILRSAIADKVDCNKKSQLRK